MLLSRFYLDIIILFLFKFHSASSLVSNNKMSSKLLKLEVNVNDFEATFQQYLKKDVYICFKSDWCPDCAAVPGIESALENYSKSRSSDLSLLIVDVGSRESWKSPDHPFRTNSLKLKGIPSLIVSKSSGEIIKLEKGLTDGSELASGGLENVQSLVTKFLESIS